MVHLEEKVRASGFVCMTEDELYTVNGGMGRKDRECNCACNGGIVINGGSIGTLINGPNNGKVESTTFQIEANKEIKSDDSDKKAMYKAITEVVGDMLVQRVIRR